MNASKSLSRTSLSRDQRGLSTVEYVIILAIVAVGGIGLWKEFAKVLKDKLGGSTTTMGTVDQ